MPDNHDAPGLKLHVPPDTLRPLIEEVVAEVLARMEAARPQLEGRMAFSEEEAARLLGLQPHVLRDERLRGRIKASTIVGRRIRYTREDLTAYLLQRRDAPDGAERAPSAVPRRRASGP